MAKLIKLIAITLVSTLLVGVGVACNKQHSHDFTNGICSCGEKGDTYMTKGLIFTLDGEKYVVSGYTGEEKTVYVPSKYNNLAVTEIGENAFMNTNIEKVFIRNGVTTISNYAFKNSSVKYVEFPDSLVIISPLAFIECENLVFTQENGLYYMGNSNNPYLLLVDSEKTITDVTVNEDCKMIVSFAFENCLELTTVKLPKNLYKICNSAFGGTVKLEKLDFYGTKVEWEKVFTEDGWLDGSKIKCISVYGDLINCGDI